MRKLTVKVSPLTLGSDEWDGEVSFFDEMERLGARYERPVPEILAPFTPGWVLIFYPAWAWPALKTLYEYVRYAVAGRCPAENSPVEKDIIARYRQIASLSDEIYERLKRHDVSTASSRIDDLQTLADDIDATLDAMEDALEWNGTKSIHRAAFYVLKRVVRAVTSARNRMMEEIDRPRPFSLANYERLVRYFKAFYDRRVGYWRRLSEITCARYIRLRQVTVLSPLWLLVRPKGLEKGLPDEYKIYAYPYAAPCNPNPYESFALLERGRVYWVCGFSEYPPGHLKQRSRAESLALGGSLHVTGTATMILRVKSISTPPPGREPSLPRPARRPWSAKCSEAYSDAVVRIDMVDPKVIRIRLEGGRGRFYHELWYGDKLLWRKEAERPYREVGEWVEITLTS